jgi:hypothetical protein
MDDLSTILSTVLGCLLVISEILAWSNCNANAITQLHRCLTCVHPLVEEEEDKDLTLARSQAATTVSG